MKHFFKQNLTSNVAGFFMATLFVLVITSCCKNCEPCNCDGKKPDYTKFFIAHAGGAIDGIVYTNCLEALDLSYSKGCKLFELDLINTSDNKLVAAHGWVDFKTLVNYSGTIDNTPLTEKEFLSLKILGKYTPLNMGAINFWFRNHPDAILVTDKINDPERIYKDFQFPDRVLMELFTWDAVDKAIELRIKPMPSENLIFGNSEKAIEMGIPPQLPLRDSNFEQILEEKKIEFIGTGLFLLRDNKDFFKHLKEKGYKTYAWLPIYKSLEEYVWIYEMIYCYGMYADNLDLLTFLLNKEATKYFL